MKLTMKKITDALNWRYLTRSSKAPAVTIECRRKKLGDLPFTYWGSIRIARPQQAVDFLNRRDPIYVFRLGGRL